ncbi:uncharacterized protein LOC128678707 [Plodia interpunctella]|uniref:uncharacterized protein LOC128677120 n=1 Tax=Plodia interpunctella TaxID=58824 RepID=UPI002368D0CF|nr:uncharacterized protein LOC128677120 [Plodia interpunctella]XP_053613722.1 uncharacterized protein LOC128677120 [Plodia interpunctella]XP_053616428.1 uncharacterized protein LOC128678707 [Plodia interpunctella]XP_053616429.1 uncharacterized protein LOC128678707 [Plodia interpunctella]
MGKRKSTEHEEEIRRKIRRLQGKLRRKKKRVIESSDTEDSGTDTYDQRGHSSGSETPPRPPYSPLTAASVSSPEPERRSSRGPDGVDTVQEPTPSTSKDNQESTNADIALQDDILSLLGDAPKAEVSFGKPLHKDVASRWQEILAKGLSTEVKAKLMEEYYIPSNCDLLTAPLLNPEAKAALTTAITKRDSSIREKQKQLGIAISALGQAVEDVISNESTKKILKPISDACRLLCDIHFAETKTRRNLISYCTNTKLKETVLESTRDKFLFGENLAEKLKSAKSIQQSGESLKIKKQLGYFNKNSSNLRTNNNNLNSKSYYRKTRFKQTGQGRAPPERVTSQRRTRGHQSPRRAVDVERQKRSAYRK